jgi:hypothetical protein
MQLVSSRCSAAEGPADDGVRRVPGPERGSVLWLQQLMGRAVLGPEKQHLGHVRDLAVRRTRAGALVSGVVVDAGGEQFLVPAESVRTWGEAGVVVLLLTSRGRCRRRNEVLLAADLLGQPVLGGADGRLPRITDVALRCTADGWAVEAVDTRGPFRRLLRASRRVIDWDVLVARPVLTRPAASTDEGPVHDTTTSREHPQRLLDGRPGDTDESKVQFLDPAAAAQPRVGTRAAARPRRWRAQRRCHR